MFPPCSHASTFPHVYPFAYHTPYLPSLSPAVASLSGARCEECVAAAAVGCLQCGGQYCNNCFQTIHMSSNSMRRHKGVPLSQLRKGPSCCDFHPAHLLDYYCEDDSECCCSECCITGGHKGHQIMSLTEMVSSVEDMVFTSHNSIICRRSYNVKSSSHLSLKPKIALECSGQLRR